MAMSQCLWQVLLLTAQFGRALQQLQLQANPGARGIWWMQSTWTITRTWFLNILSKAILTQQNLSLNFRNIETSLASSKPEAQP